MCSVGVYISVCKHMCVYVAVTVNVYIVSSSKYLLCPCCVLGFVLSAKDTVSNRQSLLWGLLHPSRRDRKQSPRRELRGVQDRVWVGMGKLFK